MEDLLQKHPDVADAAVIGVDLPDQHTEAPRAYSTFFSHGVNSCSLTLFVVVPTATAASKNLAEDIAQWVASRVADHKKLRGGVRIVESIPKSASGKILRKVLRDDAKADGQGLSKIVARL